MSLFSMIYLQGFSRKNKSRGQGHTDIKGASAIERSSSLFQEEKHSTQKYSISPPPL